MAAVKIEKEIIRPGTYFYKDQKTGQPRKLVVTPEQTRYWNEQGAAMLKAGLTIPVPCEHDFDAHPMTPAEKLLNNAGWVEGYKLKTVTDKNGKEHKDVLFGQVSVEDEAVAKRLPGTIRWTSPWINSFTDGSGKEWKNVISHLALTTRPRIVEQEPFPSIAAALSLAVEVKPEDAAGGQDGYCLSRAGRLVTRKRDNQLCPQYPMAFSLYAGGVPLATSTAPPPFKKKAAVPGKGESPFAKGETAVKGAAPKGSEGGAGAAEYNELTDDGDEGAEPDGDETLDVDTLTDPLADANGDIGMEELLCDLLQALGVPMPDESNEREFKRHLYEAAMSKIKELTSKGMSGTDDPTKQPPDQNKPPTQQPNASQPKPNPLIPQVKQEQQPMYMSSNEPGGVMATLSLDDINRIEDSTMRTVALSMYSEMERLRAESAASKSRTEALQNAELQKATHKRQQRVGMLGRLSPKVKEDLEAMLSLQTNAVSMGQDGQIIDPMKATLDMLEKGLAVLPRLMTTEQTALSVMSHPTDADALSAEGEAKLVDDMSRMMGATQARAG